MPRSRTSNSMKRQYNDVRDEGQQCLQKSLSQNARRKGKLSLMVDMPLDILFEIFQHLQPLDLLHTARTTKALRGIIMFPSSKCIWEASFAQDPDVPRCPPDMSLPSWAYLLYDQHCHVCLVARVRTPWWVLRVRMCSKCSKEALAHGRIHDGIYIEPLVPHFFSGHNITYLRSEVDEVVSVYRMLDTAGGEEALEAFKNERKKIVARNEELDSQCRKWAEIKAVERSSELRMLRMQRRDDLIARLCSVGWEEEIGYIKNDYSRWRLLTRHRLMNQARPVTERVWEKARGPLEEFLRGFKTTRLDREAQERRRHALANAPPVPEIRPLPESRAELSDERFACLICAIEYQGTWEIPCMNEKVAEIHLSSHRGYVQNPAPSVIPLSNNCAYSVRLYESSLLNYTTYMEFVEIEGFYHPDVLIYEGRALTMRGRARWSF
ncbi:hypothetical protein NEOLEDRAFT_635298 [Neolentinus lepideus HHB14362 ss-1]|uniref:F-box domain-containing protein n=1 Tax=Neolentinus lepideus HHB14362 ss-1 TaxID=1314782 RepID=A0A165QN21_9AGAM|nr:hypothetical protein NEOLEDRAFT_635298 [Neolentinus lepideus HHB14362 ss-1]